VTGQPQTTRDPSGRVRITEWDDRGQPYNLFQSQPASVLGIPSFSEVLRLEMEHARRGHLYIAASVVTNASFTGQYVGIAYNVVGYRGSAGAVLFRSGLAGTFNLASFEWDDPESYNSLAIEARQVVDGVGSSTTTGIVVLSLSVSGTYWR
jgi:hypothetical protein